MNKLILLTTGLSVVVSLQAQQKQYNANGSFYSKCISVYTSKPLRELAAESQAKAKNTGKIVAHPAPDMMGGERRTGKSLVHDANNNTPDGARQTSVGKVRPNAPIVNINGQQSTLGYYPLDPNGMIGSNYYVQTVNVNYAVYSKTGATILAATDMNVLFPGSNDDGDPVTMYDKTADRWIISEFNDNGGTIDILMFAVSTTNDPTGSYYVYSFDPNSSNTDDYPKYVVWADGYYGTCNCENSDYVLAFQRDSMLVGSTNAGYIAIPWNDSPYNFVCRRCSGPGFFCPMLLDCDETLPPYGSPEYLFYYWDDNWGSGGTDGICIDKITIDWTTHSGTTAHFDTLATAAFNSTFTGGTRADIMQPGNTASNYLDALDGFFSYRIQYLRWASYNSAVMCNVVNVGPTSDDDRVAGVRWYELHQDTGTGVWSIYQQSTYAPDDRISRWNPDISMDQNGSIGLEYSVSDSTTVYPGVRYTGRRSCDTLNTMTVTEAIVYSGNAIANTPQGSGNRWGDYSHLSIDPTDGITFWGTNMYTNSGYGSGTNIGTRIFSFQITPCTVTNVADVPNPAAAALTAYQNESMLIVKGTDFPENENLAVQLFDMNGKMLMQKEMVTNTKILETSFNVSSLAKAIYIVRIGNDHIQRVVKTAIN